MTETSKYKCDYCEIELTQEQWEDLERADLAYYGTICPDCWNKQ